MKKFTITILTTIGVLLFMSATSNAGPHFNIIVGGPGYYYYPPTPTPDYGYRDYNYHGRYHHYRHYRYWHE